MTKTNDPEWHRLFAAKADGTISPEDHERLCALLKDSAAARRDWFAFQDAESALLAWAQREALGREAGVALTANSEDRRARGGGMLRYGGALAAGIAIGVLAWAAWPKSAKRGARELAAREEATTSSVAVLARGLNMEWAGALPAPTVNAPLGPGWLRLQRGVAEIEFFQGARLCVEGPAEVQLISTSEAFCRSGRFSAHVPPQARGFKIGTPKGDIVDLGTDFGLDLNAASPELHVFKGEVEWHQPQTQMRKLTTGTATALADAAPARALVANAGAFAFSQDLDGRVNAERLAAFQRWQQTSARWNADPAARLHLEFAEEKGSRTVRNSAVHADEVAAGTIVGCNWTEGRWPGKPALQFRSVSDRVRVNIPGEYPQLTLAAWVQVHSLSMRQSQSSLCMSQGIEVGGIHWQVLHNGRLCLGLVAQAQPRVTDDYISPVVFTPERFGQWVHLAAVCDLAAGEVRFYVNGERLSSHRLKRPIAPKPATAELGNWIPSSDYRGPHPVRNLVGCIDDFSLFARALSDAEVRQHAQ
jgi:hypothetical protein